MDNNLIENRVFGKTFLWMFLGLLGTGIISWYTYSSGLAIELVLGGKFTMCLLIELAVALIFSLFFRKLPPTGAGILFFVYSMINGITLSTIFLTFQLPSILYLFGVSALVFLVFAIIGYKTDKDLSSWSPYITTFLIAGLIISLINVFLLKNPMLDIIIDWFILALFCGITIYDINKIKMLQSMPDLDQDKIHIYCAMQLYLDFINIFIRILSIFGKRRD